MVNNRAPLYKASCAHVAMGPAPLGNFESDEIGESLSTMSLRVEEVFVPSCAIKRAMKLYGHAVRALSYKPGQLFNVGIQFPSNQEGLHVDLQLGVGVGAFLISFFSVPQCPVHCRGSLIMYLLVEEQMNLLNPGMNGWQIAWSTHFSVPWVERRNLRESCLFHKWWARTMFV